MYAPACVLLDSGARYPALHNSLLEMHEGPCEYADNGRVECMQDIISAVSLQKLNEYDFSHLGQYDDCVPGPGQVAIFRNEFLRSAAGGKNDEVYMPTCMVLDEGDYPNPFWNSSNGHSGGGFGLPNDTVDSFNANGVEVELFEDVNFNLDNPAARRLGFGPGIVNDLGVYDFHDKVSGIRVHRKIFADGLYRADNNPIVYSQKRGRRVCQMTGPQWAALNYPSVSFRTATEISNAGFVGASVCTNGEVGLGPYSPPGIYKADNDPTIYALNGARACRLTWGQYVAIHQPAFTTLTGVGISVFKDSYDSGELCTDQEFGYVGLPHWKRL